MCSVLDAGARLPKALIDATRLADLDLSGDRDTCPARIPRTEARRPERGHGESRGEELGENAPCKKNAARMISFPLV
jgi:hypothetical protein